MYNLLIVDDEPLIQSGIKSMIDYSLLDINIIGIADNGDMALKMIKEKKPDIVLLDIIMPVKDGIEVVKHASTNFDSFPVFIMLTNYDEFDYVRNSLRVGAFDYIVKIELNQELLNSTLLKATKYIEQKIYTDDNNQNISYVNKLVLVNNFFVKLLNNCFFNSEEILKTMNDLEIDFSFKLYITLYFGVSLDDTKITKNNNVSAMEYTLMLLKKLFIKIFPCYVIIWNSRSFAVILGMDEEPNPDEYNSITKSILHAQDMILRYTNIKVVTGIGTIGRGPLHIPVSFNESLFSYMYCTKEKPLIDFNNISNKNLFSLSFINKNLVESIEAYDVNKVTNIFDEIILLFHQNSISIQNAIVVCSNLLHLTIISFKNDSDIFIGSFFDESDPFKTLVNLNSHEKIIEWINELKNIVCKKLSENYIINKNWLIPKIKNYIDKHYREQLSLSDIAQAFDLSPGYISSLFSKYNDVCFSEYIVRVKIIHAKKLLKENAMKIHQVSYYLGFSDPYYFSKVFKKYVGISPKDYVLRNCLT